MEQSGTKSRSHLLSNRHEEVVEHLESDRVCLCAYSERPLGTHHALEYKVAGAGELGSPPWLHHHGACMLQSAKWTSRTYYFM